MGDYARGDCKKVICSSEEEELQPEPASLTPHPADDTDRQFWAEDEMSSSDSRLQLVCRQRRRHSLAYRNRVAVRKRSRSFLCQSSSSNSDPGAHLKILSPTRRRRRCNLGQGPSATKKSREGSSGFIRTSTSTRRDSEVSNRSTVNASFIPRIQHLNSRRQTHTTCAPSIKHNSTKRRNRTPNLLCSCITTIQMNESPNNDKYQNQRSQCSLNSKHDD